MLKPPVALQLYTVREAMAEDFFGTLAKVKDMGYDHVEFIDDFYGHTAREVRAELDRLHLKAVSSHVPFGTLVGQTQDTIDKYKLLGCEFLAVPWLDEPRRPGAPAWPEVVGQIGAVGKACRDAGMTLLYHNHDFEFVKIDGEYALDLLYAAIPADALQMELDTCWAQVAGVDPAAYLLKYAGRSPVVHLKDFVTQGKEKPKRLYALIGAEGERGDEVSDGGGFDFRPVGYGMLNVPAVLEASMQAGARYFVVEQDRSTGRLPLEAAKLSRGYLKSLGF
jgi:sugar phosphate isomerase/epimerase